MPLLPIHTMMGVTLLFSLLSLFLGLGNAFTTQLDRRRWNHHVQIHLHNANNKDASTSSSDPLVRSRMPHQLSNGRGTFLGFRNTKDVMPNGLSTTPLKSSAEALMPDGGLSPCVIRVLGVGGGGCNAVRSKGMNE